MATRTAAPSTYEQDVRAAAAGLAGLGLERGEPLACWLTDRPERQIVDAAAMRLGVTSLAIDTTSTADQAARVLADAGARVLVCERVFLGPSLRIRDGGRTALEYVAVVDDDDAMDATSWEELLELGKGEAGKSPEKGHRVG